MVIGIDYSSYDAHLCGVGFDGGKPKLVRAVFRPAKASGEAAAIEALKEVGVMLASAVYEFGSDEPHVFFVERGFGASRRADWILGAFFAAVYVTLAGYGPTNVMEAREWKREVTLRSGVGLTVKGCGNPNVNKDVANEATRALLGLVEVDGSDWSPDELDAYGIAWTGRRLNARALGERAA
jgi:hypothetical protein